MAEFTKIAPGQVVAGRYRVQREIGRGAVGSVHLVQHVHTDEQFALKVLHDPAGASPEKIARFRVEAKAPARIDSDHVVRITDADVAQELGGAPFFVMEYLRGHDLGAELDARGMLPPEEVVLYMRQAARALDKAHALGIIHRDLKPENLFLTEREDGVPVIKLVDWGIAKLTGDAATIAQLVSRTQTGRIFGTPLFMSPEQATGRVSLVGPATDVWALGLVVNRLLSGRDHFEAETVAELIGKISYEPIKAPSSYGVDFGPAYDAWFLKCCNREISYRFRTAGEAVTALASALRVEEGDALIDSVISSRRAQAEMMYREVARASGSASVDVDVGEASTLDVKVPAPPSVSTASPPVASSPAVTPHARLALTPPPVPPPALFALAPPPVPPRSNMPSTPPQQPGLSQQSAPPLTPFGRPSAAPEPVTGTGITPSAMALTTPEEEEEPRTSRGVVVLAVGGSLVLGLVIGLLFFSAATGGSSPAGEGSAAGAGSSAPSATVASPLRSGGGVIPASTVGTPSASASAAPSAPRSSVRPGGDPLQNRH